MSQAPLLEVKNLSKHFLKPQKKELFSGVNFSIYPGQTVAIIGPSGCGKTTLLHILATLEAPSSGQLFLDGKPFSEYSSSFLRCEKMGFVFQNFNLIESLSPIDNVLLPAKIRGLKEGDRQRACGLLEQMGIHHKIEATSYLSGGEKQRVALARALMNNPRLLLADEPTGNLDETMAKYLCEELILHAKEENRGLVLVTHSPSLALLCDTIYTLSSHSFKPVAKESL